MDLGTQLSGSQSAKCVRRVHGYVNSVGFGVDGFGVATGRMTVHPPVSMSPIRFDSDIVGLHNYRSTETFGGWSGQSCSRVFWKIFTALVHVYTWHCTRMVLYHTV